MGIGPYEAFLALDWLGPLKRVQTMGRLSAAGVDTFRNLPNRARAWHGPTPHWHRPA